MEPQFLSYDCWSRVSGAGQTTDGHLLRFNYLFILLMLQPGSSQAPAGSERPTDQIDNQSDIISQRGRKTANKSWQAGLPTPPPHQE